MNLFERTNALWLKQFAYFIIFEDKNRKKYELLNISLHITILLLFIITYSITSIGTRYSTTKMNK